MNKTLSKVIMIRTNRSNENKTLTQKCPNTEFFLVRIFMYSVRVQENTDQRKVRIWTLFTQWNYVKERNHCISLLKKTKKEYYSSSDKKNICDSKTFWKIAKSMSSKKIKSNERITLTENDAIIKTEKGFNH